MFPKFSALPLGAIFESNGTAYRKTGDFTLVEYLNDNMGEMTIIPFIEDRIKVSSEISAETAAIGKDFYALEGDIE